MDLRQLKYFLSVAEEGSFLRAAEALHVSQPALTRSIRLLEESLSARLFQRMPRGVRLTQHGETLREYARSILSDVSRAEAEMRELDTAPIGTATVGVLPSLANSLLPEAMIRLMQNHPGTRVRLVERNNIELIPGLLRGDYDLIIGIGEGSVIDGGLHYEPLLHDWLVIVLRPGHPLARMADVSIRDLSRFPWILPASGTLHRRRLDDLFHSAGMATPNSGVEGGSLQFIRAMLAESDYLAMLPELCIRVDISAGILTTLRLRSEFFRRAVGLITRPSHTMPLAGRLLIQHIRDAANAQAPALERGHGAGGHITGTGTSRSDWRRDYR